MSQIDVLIMAAGKGERIGGEPKQFAPLNGKPMFVWSVECFTAHAAIDRVTIVVAPGNEGRVLDAVDKHGLKKVSGVVPGGETRQESVRFGLEFLDPQSEFVLVHDAARPCLSPKLLQRILDALANSDAVVPTLPVVDTMVCLNASRVEGIVDRGGLSVVQTPQAFRTELLVRAHQMGVESGVVSSDDGSLVVALGEPVTTVTGERTNIKVTFDEDVQIAEATLG